MESNRHLVKELPSERHEDRFCKFCEFKADTALLPWGLRNEAERRLRQGAEGKQRIALGNLGSGTAGPKSCTDLCQHHSFSFLMPWKWSMPNPRHLEALLKLNSATLRFTQAGGEQTALCSEAGKGAWFICHWGEGWFSPKDLDSSLQRINLLNKHLKYGTVSLNEHCQHPCHGLCFINTSLVAECHLVSSPPLSTPLPLLFHPNSFPRTEASFYLGCSGNISDII